MLTLCALGCSTEEAPGAPDEPGSAWVEIGGVLFELELALDPQTRHRGLGGRRQIAPTGGMLFAASAPARQSMVMRDCPIAIDVAFLDREGRVVAIHEMQPEPPRQAGETPQHYERRLPSYPSGSPAWFAVETAGGRLAELGVRVGDTFVFDAPGLIARARRAGF